MLAVERLPLDGLHVGLGLHVGNWFASVGTPAFFNAFFSTVFVRLEASSWGSRFPVVMNDLYAGHVSPSAAAPMLTELETLRCELAKLPPNDVVWDFENLAARPPWGDDIAESITSLANYFVTDDGEDLIETLVIAATQAARHDRAIEVR